MKVSSKLLAGGGVGDNDRSGLITINLNFNNWYDKVFGSAFIYIMLIAGAGADNIPTRDGDYTFTMDVSPSETSWSLGSALIFYSSFIRILYLWN